MQIMSSMMPILCINCTVLTPSGWCPCVSLLLLFLVIQPQYAVTELSEKDFWRMFDNRLYFQCREKYGAVGTFMSAYYKSKKG